MKILLFVKTWKLVEEISCLRNFNNNNYISMLERCRRCEDTEEEDDIWGRKDNIIQGGGPTGFYTCRVSAE